VSEANAKRSERALRKTRTMNVSREMAADKMATSTTKLTHSLNSFGSLGSLVLPDMGTPGLIFNNKLSDMHGTGEVDPTHNKN
jgi:hypothetical protein